MKARYKFIPAVIGIVALLILMFMWLTGNLSPEGKIQPGKNEVTEMSASGLKTIQVSAVSAPVEVECVGTVSAREAVEISSRIMAEIREVKADSGDKVNSGESLFVLDSRDAVARLEQARENLASAEAALERASLDAGRIEKLYEKQAATKQEHDAAQASLKMARASAEAARAMVREADVHLSHAVITSPINGVVIDRLADPGDLAVPGKPLMSIYDPLTLRLEVSVHERLRQNIRVGETVRASIDSLGKEFRGTVEEIVPASDSSSRSFIVRVSIPPIEGVYPGMYGRMWLSTGSSEVILIPPNVVSRVGQIEIVSIVEEGTVRKRSVKTGKEYPDGIEILSGLQAGDVIIVP